MTRLIEFETQDGTAVLIAPAHIVSCIPIFRDDGVWRFTRVHTSDGEWLAVNASLEQIQEALEQAA